MSASETLTCKGSPQTHIKLSYFPWNCYPDLLNTLVYDWMKLLIILVIYKVFFLSVMSPHDALCSAWNESRKTQMCSLHCRDLWVDNYRQRV